MRANVWRALGRQIRRPSGWMGRALGRLMSWEHRALTQWALAGLDVAADHAVLDIGCGGGAAVASLAGLAPEGVVVGLDYSAEMTRQARRRMRGSSGRVCIMQGQVETLPFDGATFDRVVAIESFFFWDDPVLGLREVRRVLRHGGRCAIVMESSRESPAAHKAEKVSALLNVRFYSGAEVVELLRAAGFREAGYETLPDRARGWLCATGVA